MHKGRRQLLHGYLLSGDRSALIHGPRRPPASRTIVSQRCDPDGPAPAADRAPMDESPAATAAAHSGRPFHAWQDDGAALCVVRPYDIFSNDGYDSREQSPEATAAAVTATAKRPKDRILDEYAAPTPLPAAASRRVFRQPEVRLGWFLDSVAERSPARRVEPSRRPLWETSDEEEEDELPLVFSQDSTGAEALAGHRLPRSGGGRTARDYLLARKQARRDPFWFEKATLQANRRARDADEALRTEAAQAGLGGVFSMALTLLSQPVCPTSDPGNSTVVNARQFYQFALPGSSGGGAAVATEHLQQHLRLLAYYTGRSSRVTTPQRSMDRTQSSGDADATDDER